MQEFIRYMKMSLTDCNWCFAWYH